jgi:hypothetical protein
VWFQWILVDGRIHSDKERGTRFADNTGRLHIHRGGHHFNVDHDHRGDSGNGSDVGHGVH